MTLDFKAQVKGHFVSGRKWSTGLHITSSQSESALLTTWSNAVIAAWTHATYGLNLIYPTNTLIDSFQVSTLNASMLELSKSVLVSSHAGITGTASEPERLAINVFLSSDVLANNARGFMRLPAPITGVFLQDVMDPTIGGHIKSAITDIFAAIRADGSTVFSFNRKLTKKLALPAFSKEVLTVEEVSDAPSSCEQRGDKRTPIYY